MGFSCGIVGLPNVGKSTLFNALTKTAAAQAANYPFCTIEPNIGKVAVPDERVDILAKIAGSAKLIPTQLEFVDIAGLVKGASKGEGLGNQFLAHIREVDVIVYVLRCFEDENITHVEGGVDPIRDAEIIETELIIADMESLQKRLAGLEKRKRTNDKEAIEQAEIIEKVLPFLEKGQPAISAPIKPDEQKQFKMLQLLTGKKVMYVANMNDTEVADGNDYSRKAEEYAASRGADCVRICARIEEEIAQLEDIEEQKMFLETIGQNEPGLNRVIRSGYKLLGLNTFFTIGPKEAHAWTVRKGAAAPEAAGQIHTDFEKGFIAAEIIHYDDYVSCKGETGAKEAGKMSLTGRDYIMQDGDVVHFRFNV